VDEGREELRRQVYLAYSHHGAVYCPWCERRVSAASELHEYLIKRNAIPPSKQPLIMTVENCILVHQGCHHQSGQTKAFRAKCLLHAAKHVGATRIGEWYYDLAHTELMSLPQGILAAKGTQTTYSMALDFLQLGISASEVTLPSNWMGHAATGQAILAWRGKMADDIPLNGLTQEYVVALIEAGRWLSYLQGVCQ